MTGMIQRRETFLANIAKLGRSPKTELPRPTWQYQPQDRVLKDATKDELVEILIKQCANIHTNIVISNTATLPEDLQDVVDKYGGQSVITWKDKRFQDYGLSALMNEQHKPIFSFMNGIHSNLRKISVKLKKQILA